MDVIVIILNWNKPELSRKAVESVIFPPSIDGKIILADNGSTDHSLALFQEIPGIDLLPLEHNYGFAQGYNLSAAYAQEAYRPRYLLLLNNDAQLGEKTLELLYSQKGRAAILSPKIYYADRKTIWACGGRLNLRLGRAINIGQGERDQGQYDRLDRIDFASGCALWLDTEVLSKIPLFAPEFISYFEDVDFGYRARTAGFPIGFVPQAVVYHDVGRTAGDEYGLFQSRIRWRNRLLMVKRNGEPAEKLFFSSLVLPGLILRDSFRYLRRKKYKELQAAFQGLLQLPADLRSLEMQKNAFLQVVQKDPGLPEEAFKGAGQADRLQGVRNGVPPQKGRSKHPQDAKKS